MAADQPEVVFLPTLPYPKPIQSLDYALYRDSGIPIIIDNGSSNLRYGFAAEAEDAQTAILDPFSGTNVVARFKDRKTNQQVLLFGDSVEFDSGARAQARNPWEGDVLLNFDALENALDHVFVHLGVDSEACVNHPVMMSERLCSPLHSRQYTSEIMFELYGVPKLLYSIDSMMSLYYNHRPQFSNPYTADGLVISFNTASTSVIPVLAGRGILNQSKRIPWGASQAAEYLQKLVQLKYASFPSKLTMPQCTWLFQNVCSFASDYTELLRTLKDPIQMRAHEKIIQFPFAAAVEIEKTEEELARAAEKRRAQGKKLQEMAATKRAEKLADMEKWLAHLTEVVESRDTVSGEEWDELLAEEGYANDAELEADLKKAEKEVNKRRKKDGLEVEEPEEEEPSFPLIDTPDDQLDEDGIKEKRKQKMMKAGWEARVRARKEKEREREEKEAEEQREADERATDLSGWADKLRTEHDFIMGRMKERARRKAALSDRKSAAAQNRMKSIATLAADDRVPKKRRKTGGEDMFGADDDDWAIYRKINTAAAESDEEDDFARLAILETKLLAHDPSFQMEHTYSALSQQRSALLQAFRPIYAEDDAAGATRVHLSTERWRACETWFTPGMAGVDAAGLGEVIQNILTSFSEAEKARLVNNVFVTGAPSQLPELMPRLHNVLRPILPPEMPLHVSRADNPVLDAWRGMAHCSLRPDVWRHGVTYEEYQEWGGERIKRWWGGNWNASFIDEKSLPLSS